MPSRRAWPPRGCRRWTSEARPVATPSRTSSGSREPPTASAGRSTPCWPTATPSSPIRRRRPRTPSAAPTGRHRSQRKRAADLGRDVCNSRSHAVLLAATLWGLQRSANPSARARRDRGGTTPMATSHRQSEVDTDVVIVGAGLSGIGAACRLQLESPDRSYLVLEARDAVGGTWDLFRYPGI